jgi:hypothetical protein
MGYGSAVVELVVVVEGPKHRGTKLTALGLGEIACLVLTLRLLDDLEEGLLYQRNPIQVRNLLVLFVLGERVLLLLGVLVSRQLLQHYSLLVVHYHLQTSPAEGPF